MIRVEQLVERAAQQRPNLDVLRYYEHRWSGAALALEMNRRAAVLVAAGLPVGAVVATTEPVTDHVAIAFLACCRADLTFMHLMPGMAATELRLLMHRAGVACILTADGERDAACPEMPVLPIDLPGIADARAREEMIRRSQSGTVDAVASLIATSGTTGSTPKLVRAPHRTMTWRGMLPLWWEQDVRVFYRFQATNFNARTFCTMLHLPAPIVLSQTLDPRRMEEEIVRANADGLMTTPVVARLLAEQPQPPPEGIGLRFISTGGAPIPIAAQHAAVRRYRATLVQEYGSSEGGALIGTPQGGAPEGSIGVPYPGVEAQIVDEDGRAVPKSTIGELIVRSPGLMLGYVDNPSATDAALRDGWLWTGDLAYRDANGFVFLSGRRALRINVGGFKVAPEEVEAILEQHPAVRDAVVLGAPDLRRGEVVRAIIVPQGEPPTVGELRRFCRERLATYKVPRFWEFREDLPRSPLGKVLRHDL